MVKQELINHWKKQADLDFKTMEDMFKSKHYQWALFVGHLVVEKWIEEIKEIRKWLKNLISQ
ncbi:MAG: HEPN domain-containing protein [Endomicrobium sp.]|jgi:HEPN domain-containing protein|nr:HEPN domain-containing protein [Endomicrobium sp.]